MLFLIVEHFKNGDAVPVYRRFRDRGRMAPDGVTYLGSWVTTDLARCFCGGGGNDCSAPVRRWAGVSA
jgi:hypothetical protein